jgi:hypothetical protein
VVLGCLNADEIATAVFATAPLRRGENGHSRNLAFRLKSENCGTAVANDPPNACPAGAAVDDKDALAVALGTSADPNICHGKLAAFNRTFTC